MALRPIGAGFRSTFSRPVCSQGTLVGPLQASKRNAHASQWGWAHSGQGSPAKNRFNIAIANHFWGPLAGRIVQEGTPSEIYNEPKDPQAAELFDGANVFHARVINGWVASPFGQTAAKSVAEREWSEVIYRPASVPVAEKGVPARVLAVRPYAGQLEVEVAFLPHALPEGLEAPAIIRSAAPLHTALAPRGGGGLPQSRKMPLFILAATSLFVGLERSG
jgi:hypothetical protein